MAAPTPQTEPCAQSLPILAAARRGAWAEAAEHLDRAGAALEDPTLQGLIALFLAGQQWSLALSALALIRQPDDGCTLRRHLALNMACLQQYRPQAYHTLVTTRDPARYQVLASPHGLGIVQQMPDGARHVLGPTSPQVDMSGVQLAMRGQPGTTGAATALCGLGDGMVARLLAPYHWSNGPTVLEPFIYLIEPDVGLVMHAFMLQDLTGPQGPIERPRVLWFVGPHWEQALRTTLLNDPGMLLPTVRLPLSRLSQAIGQAIDRIDQASQDQVSGYRRQIEEYYRTLTPRNLQAILGPNPPRQPRILVPTSRLTTVLQYSSQDCATALEKLGWETRLLIEPTPQHNITPRLLLARIAEFKPDAVLALDALRCHPPGIFPPQLLYLGWVQDDLARLTNPDAGASIGPLDFVLLPAAPHYVRHYGYPGGQCLYLEKLSRPPVRPATWASDGDDLVYVSNAARPPQQIVQDILSSYAAQPIVHPLIRAVADELDTLYAAGGAVWTLSQMQRLVARHAQTLGIRGRDPAALHTLELSLFTRLNNNLFRQQALEWVVQLVQRLGLSLGLYGHAWEAHPRFAAYARGYVTYGPDLEALTRRTRINLQILPFTSLHQRLLDGILAGGFYLIRAHPLENVFHRMLDFVEAHLPAETADLATARHQLAGAERAQFDQIVATWQDLVGPEYGDPLARLRELLDQGARFCFTGLPCFDDGAFRDPAGLEARLRRFLHDEPARRAIWRQQCDFVEEHLTYEAGLRRILAHVHQRLRAGGAPSN